MLVPPTGPPTMLVGPESVEDALLAGQICTVRVLREFTHPDEDYPYSTVRSLAETVGSAASRRRIGLAGRTLSRDDLMAAFRQTLPHFEWLDVENAMCELHAVRTPAERAVIGRAYQIAEAGLHAALETVRPGVTERSIAAEIDAAMRRMGSEGTGIDTIVASGENTRPILARSTFRTVQSNDLVLLTIAPRYEGYHAAIGRPALVGTEDRQIRAAVEVAGEAQEAYCALMRPGIQGLEVEVAGRRIVEHAGLGKFFPYSGVHSVCVIEFEPPIFGPKSAAVLSTNMVISVDIPLFNTPWAGLRIEDGFLITDTGAMRLNTTPPLIQK
ncbi:MAG TPA: Xaa-Pro peptidase family protein [Aggregatilineales bacterium]|nr:Xaa-Pro peptidase family protein [Aggregatilineales bacterium]